uniref:Uncharacterized protein n=1 Tax=viral metagenome TaxID=1070528 RepID=A0A6H1Z9K6_9ZZZZ
MKKLTIILALALTLCLSSNLSAQPPEEVPNIEGNWLLTIYLSLADTTIYDLPYQIIQNDRHTIVVDYYTYEGRGIAFNNTIVWYFPWGCYALYYGRIETDYYMHGYMECQRSPDWGEWWADKVD